jgi:hypothetical protein
VTAWQWQVTFILMALYEILNSKRVLKKNSEL